MIRSLARFPRNQRILALVRLAVLRVGALLQCWGKILGHAGGSEGLTLGHVMIARRNEEEVPVCVLP